MPSYEFGATGQHRERLNELAAVLIDCREVFVAAAGTGLLTPREGSVAAQDQSLRLSGPAGPWPRDAGSWPRSLAAKLIRQQVDYSASLGASVAAGEMFDPMSSLVRGAVEYATRAVWVIDPLADNAADPTAGLRIRSARALLAELVSAEELINALTGRTDVGEELDRLKDARRKLRQIARDMFDDVNLASDRRSQWAVDGQQYSSWSAIAKSWAELESAPVHGGRLYGLLTVESHPQGFIGTRGQRPTAAGPVRAVTMVDVERRVQLALAASYSSVKLLANYNGHEPEVLDQWATRLEQALPEIFRPDDSST